MTSTLETLQAILGADAANYTDAQLNLFISMATARTDVACFAGDPMTGSPSMYQQFLAFTAAHLLAVTAARGLGGASGPVISERAGEVSRQYGYSANRLDRDGLMSTPYGQQVMSLQRMLGCTHMFTTYGYDGAGSPALGDLDSFDG